MTLFIIYLWLGICSGLACYLSDSKKRAGCAVLFGIGWPIITPIYLFANLYGD